MISFVMEVVIGMLNNLAWQGMLSCIQPFLITQIPQTSQVGGLVGPCRLSGRGLDYEEPGRLLEDFALLVTLKRLAIFSSSSTNSPLKTEQ
jgi:hypothetical protein